MKNNFKFLISLRPVSGQANFKLKGGYTLIELIAVAGIIMVFSTVIASMIVFALRGASTAKIANLVGQNGNYAQSAFTNILLSARKIKKVGVFDTDNCATPPSPLSYTNVDSIQIEQLDGALTKVSCTATEYIRVDVDNSAPTPTPIITDKSLIDKSEVRVTNCSFTCTQTSTFTPPLVQITFTIQDKNGIFSDQKYTSTFNTSVSLRNFK